MPAGLLLSPTARTVRSGPGMEPSRRRCRRPQVPLPRRQERPAARLRKVPWELSPSPSCAVRRRGCSCGAFRSYRPQSRLPPAPSPARWLGQKHGHRPPIPARVPLWLPSPAWGDTHPSCPAPLTGVSLPVSSCAPCRKRSSPCFSPAGPPSQRCVRPAPSRPEDCALNQHFSSHPGTFVQRKMIL